MVSMGEVSRGYVWGNAKHTRETRGLLRTALRHRGRKGAIACFAERGNLQDSEEYVTDVRTEHRKHDAHHFWENSYNGYSTLCRLFKRAATEMHAIRRSKVAENNKKCCESC